MARQKNGLQEYVALLKEESETQHEINKTHEQLHAERTQLFAERSEARVKQQAEHTKLIAKKTAVLKPTAKSSSRLSKVHLASARFTPCSFMYQRSFAICMYNSALCVLLRR